MKRLGGMFDLISDRQNLVIAMHRAALGKRDRGEVREFLDRSEVELCAIGEQLRRGTYEFSPYRVFRVRDTKSRQIHAPSFRDRVVHHAIITVTGPAFEKGALDHSYACRRGKGQHAALRQAIQWTRRADWYGKLDIAKFYDNVDHDVLRRLLSRRFRERRLLALFDRLLASYETASGKGLPIGALTSQYLGNFVLDEFDRRMKATGQCQRYLRYMDDIVIWGNSASLKVVRQCATEILDTLGLRLKNGGEWNQCAQGIPFLGFIVYPDRTRLGRLARRRLRRKTRALERAWLHGEIDEQTLQDRGTSLFAHAAFADDLAWRRTVIALGRYEEFEECTQGEALEPRPRPAGRFLEQFGQELPVRDPQQEQGGQPQQERRFPSLSGSRHGDKEQQLQPPDDALSRSRRASGRDKPSGKTSADIDIFRGQRPRQAEENLSAEAPPEKGEVQP